MLADAGPLRDDGSDKFWGFENVSSTLRECRDFKGLTQFLRCLVREYMVRVNT